MSAAIAGDERPSSLAGCGRFYVPTTTLSETQTVPPTPFTAAQHAVALTAKLQREYVAGGQWIWYENQVRALPWAIDDVTSDFGDDLYERMLLYPQVSSALTTLKTGMLEGGVQVQPAVDDKDEPGYDLAIEIRDRAEKMLAGLDVSLDDVLWNMADALMFGNKLAEQVYELQAGKLNLVRLAVKPRHSVAFAVDTYNKVIGVLGLMPGVAMPVQAGMMLIDPAAVKNLLPRAKFAIFSNHPRNSDPRGTSIARPAYAPWQRAMQLWPDYLKYLAQFAGPSLVGVTPPGAQGTAADSGQVDGNGDPVFTFVTPEQVMRDTLLQFQNGTAVSFPNGSTVTPIEMQGNGEAFRAALDRCDGEITQAILTQSLTTQPTEHGTHALGSVQQDGQDALVRTRKRGLERMLRQDVLVPWVRYNWGDKAADELVPIVQLGDEAAHNFTANAAAYASLQSVGLLHPSQYAGIDKNLGLPPRDMSQDEPTPPVEILRPQKVVPTEGGAPIQPPQPGQAATPTKPAAQATPAKPAKAAA